MADRYIKWVWWPTTGQNVSRDHLVIDVVGTTACGKPVPNHARRSNHKPLESAQCRRCRKVAIEQGIPA